jgi:hypothetical protein
VHVVFTLPHALLPLAYRNATRLYTWLFQVQCWSVFGANASRVSSFSINSLTVKELK